MGDSIPYVPSFWLNVLFNIVQITGRRRFNCVLPQWELKGGLQSYREALHSERDRILPETHPLTVMADHVLERLVSQAHIEGANWKVHVIHDDTYDD